MSDGIKNMYEELEDDIHRHRLQKLTSMNKSELLNIFSKLDTEIRILERDDLTMTYSQHMRFKEVYDLIMKLP